jgi:transcriptional regulator with XRE-family HTH domain
MDISKRIKEKGMSVAEVAARLRNNRGGLGISQPSMSSLINGNPTFSRLQEIATILNITVSELVRDDAPQVSPVAHCPHCGHELTVELK